MNLNKAKNWRDAVCLIVDDKTSNFKCFTSGEVTRTIREERLEMKVSVPDVGTYLRELFYNGAIMYGKNSAHMVPKYARGIYNTPYGQLIYVYAPNQYEGEMHNFEIEIPKTPMTKFFHGSTQKQKISTMPSRTKTASRSTAELVATVHADGRLCIPGNVFLAYARKFGATITPGAVVFAGEDTSFHPSKILISTNANNLGATQKRYTLTKDLGRIKFTPANGKMSWKTGDRYPVELTRDLITVDIMKPL